MLGRKRPSPSAADVVAPGYLYGGGPGPARELAHRDTVSPKLVDACFLRLAGETTATKIDVWRAQEVVSYRHGGYTVDVETGCYNDIYLMRNVADLVHETIKRCIPWADALTVPRFTASRGYQVRGTSFSGNRMLLQQPLIVVVLSRLDAWTLMIAHHEIWHAIEAVLSPEFLLDMNSAVAASPDFGDAGYIDSDVERRARLYESYASARDLGLPAAKLDRSIVGTFEYVYSGELAKYVLSLGDPTIDTWMRGGAASEAQKPPPREIFM